MQSCTEKCVRRRVQMVFHVQYFCRTGRNTWPKVAPYPVSGGTFNKTARPISGVMVVFDPLNIYACRFSLLTISTKIDPHLYSNVHYLYVLYIFIASLAKFHPIK